MICSVRPVISLVAVLFWAGAEPLLPNELGGVMILEYHKVDRPGNRWTQTAENFRRDLQRLWKRVSPSIAKRVPLQWLRRPRFLVAVGPAGG